MDRAEDICWTIRAGTALAQGKAARIGRKPAAVTPIPSFYLYGDEAAGRRSGHAARRTDPRAFEAPRLDYSPACAPRSRADPVDFRKAVPAFSDRRTAVRGGARIPSWCSPPAWSTRSAFIRAPRGASSRPRCPSSTISPATIPACWPRSRDSAGVYPISDQRMS